MSESPETPNFIALLHMANNEVGYVRHRLARLAERLVGIPIIAEAKPDVVAEREPPLLSIASNVSITIKDDARACIGLIESIEGALPQQPKDAETSLGSTAKLKVGEPVATDRPMVFARSQGQWQNIVDALHGMGLNVTVPPVFDPEPMPETAPAPRRRKPAPKKLAVKAPARKTAKARRK